jgi:transcriptional regulator with XRE-family HTH domain
MSIRISGDGLLNQIISAYPVDMIGVQVRAARALLSWDQKDLADAAGVSERAIMRFEAGTAVPRRATMAAIERAFNEAGVIFIEESGVVGVLLRRRDR